MLSETWKAEPAAQVVAWLDAQLVETLFLSAVTVAELRFGLAAMPAGKRRDMLHLRLEDDVLPLFATRVLPFDLGASRHYADLMARARAAGRGVGTADGYIAAIAAAHGLTVATRDTAPFEATGVDFIDPWSPTS